MLRVSVVSGSVSLVSKEFVGSKSAFEAVTLEFTASKESATLIFENASGPGESCVSVADVSVRALAP